MGYWLLAFVIWAMALPAAVDLIRHRRAGARLARLTQLLALSLGVLGQSSAIRLRIDDVTGVGCLGIWISFTLIIVSSVSFWILVAAMMHRPGSGAVRNGVRAGLTAVTVATMGVLLLGSDAVDRRGHRFIATYAGEPRIAAFYLVYTAYLAVLNVDLLRLTWRSRRYPRSPYLRAGLNLLIAGAFAGLGYVCYMSTIVLTRYRHLPDPPRLAVLAGIYFGYTVIVLVTVAPTISVWGPWFVRPWRAYRHTRTLRALAPLTRALEPLIPSQINYEPTYDTLEYRLIRQLVALRDAMFQLAPYRTPRLRALAVEAAASVATDGVEFEAVTEAYLILFTLRTRAAAVEGTTDDSPDTVPASVPSINPALADHQHGGALLRHERRELLRIARAFTRLRDGATATAREKSSPVGDAAGSHLTVMNDEGAVSLPPDAKPRAR